MFIQLKLPSVWQVCQSQASHQGLGVQFFEPLQGITLLCQEFEGIGFCGEGIIQQPPRWPR